MSPQTMLCPATTNRPTPKNTDRPILFNSTHRMGHFTRLQLHQLDDRFACVRAARNPGRLASPIFLRYD